MIMISTIAHVTGGNEVDASIYRRSAQARFLEQVVCLEPSTVTDQPVRQAASRERPGLWLDPTSVGIDGPKLGAAHAHHGYSSDRR